MWESHNIRRIVRLLGTVFHKKKKRSVVEQPGKHDSSTVSPINSLHYNSFKVEIIKLIVKYHATYRWSLHHLVRFVWIIHTLDTHPIAGRILTFKNPTASSGSSVHTGGTPEGLMNAISISERLNAAAAHRLTFSPARRIRHTLGCCLAPIATLALHEITLPAAKKNRY